MKKKSIKKKSIKPQKPIGYPLDQKAKKAPVLGPTQRDTRAK